MNGLLSLVRKNWVATMLAILSAITVLSLWPLSQLPQAPGGDKLHHVIAYALLMLPVALRKPNGWTALGMLFIFYSGGIELIQPFVNRQGDWWDLLANAAGVVLGAFLAVVLEGWFPPANSRRAR